jgi:hypothetical protein
MRLEFQELEYRRVREAPSARHRNLVWNLIAVTSLILVAIFLVQT